MPILSKVITGTIATGLALSVGAAGIIGSDGLSKAVSCVLRDVQIEHGDNYYCGSEKDYGEDKASAAERFETNATKGQGEYGYLQLLVINDEEFADELGQSLADRYDPDRGEFMGEIFDNDFLYQMQLGIDVLNKKGVTEIPDGNVGDAIYNLYNQ